MQAKKLPYKRSKLSLSKILIYIVLIAYTVFLFFPIITVLITSFMPTDELATHPGFLWWSPNASLDAYAKIFEFDMYANLVGMPGLVLGFVNTMWITLI